MPLATDKSDRYGGVAIALHWLIAGVIIAIVLIGWNMVGLPLSPHKLQLYALHKSLGLSILAVASLRLLWRATHTPPTLEAMPAWQRVLAAATHAVLYALLLLLPLSGWLYNSVVGFPLSWFGLVTIPPLAPADPAWKALSHTAHIWLGWILVGLVALHTAAALHHHLVLRDRTLHRMLPWLRVPTRLLLAAALSLLLPVVAQAANWTVQPAGSTLGFRATQEGAPFDGSFKHFDAKIDFDPANPGNGKVSVTVDILSATTGAPDRDQQLPAPEWFDTPHFPHAVFEASHFDATGPNAYVASGTLTIRDRTIPIKLPFTLKMEGDTAVMDGKADLDRTAFGIGQGEWASDDVIGKTVTVLVHLTARRAD